METVSDEDFESLTRGCKRAFHIEIADEYRVESEDEHFRRFLDGEPDDYAWQVGWADFVREATAAGTRFQRVRLVSEPHCDYTRWGLAVSPVNIAAGEDIRYLPRHLADGIDFPEDDFWLLDDDTLILSLFTPDGRTGFFARSSSPELLSQCIRVRDEVWKRAIPYAEYV
jgi:hypothetical protein